MDIKDLLYDRLPEIYRRVDAEQPSPYPLKRYLEILTEGGLQQLLNSIEALRKIQNIDDCPKEFLPLIAQQYGLEFPYDMSETAQRKFIKVLPKLYAYKGTEEAFKFLAREIFGEATNLKANMAQKPKELSEEEWEKLGDWQKLLVYLEIDGETLRLENKHINFIKFCELIRPVNTTVIPYLALFYQDNYYRLNKSEDNRNLDYITEKNAEKTTKPILDTEDITKPIELWKDVYRMSPSTSNLLNTSRLNNNFVLNTLGIIDNNLDILKLSSSDIRKQRTFDYKLDIVKDDYEFNAIKEKTDEEVSISLRELKNEIRSKLMDDKEDLNSISELMYDVSTLKTSDEQNIDSINTSNIENYEVDVKDTEDFIKVSRAYLDVYKNSFYTRLNVKGELNKNSVTNTTGFTDYNLDVTKDLNLDYARKSKEGKGLTILKDAIEERTPRPHGDTSKGKFTRTRKATLLNRTGLVLNRSFVTNDGILRVVNMDY